MKFMPETTPPPAPETLEANAFALPGGLIGFPDYKRAELLYSAAQLPFLWMRLPNPSGGSVFFVVIEPGGVVPGYELELFDTDAQAIGLTDAADAMVLNIVTVRREHGVQATVNLTGPIVVNRRTRVGRQVVIANHSKYSARHLLVKTEPAAVRATA